MSYTIGQQVHLTATFKVGTVLTDPTSVSLTIKDPAGAVTTPSPTKDSVGVYHYDLNVALAGQYWHTWKGTGACQAAGQDTFDVWGDHTV